MLEHIGLLVAGGALLYLGAEWLVQGAAGLARVLGVAPIVIGLTVVAYGTSAPEVVVTLIAAVDGRSAIALGNVIGSNIANLGLILGLTAAISPPRVEAALIRREVPVLIAVSVLLPLMLIGGEVSRPEGLVLLAAATAFTILTLRLTRAVAVPPKLAAEVNDEVEREAGRGSRARLAVLTVLGLVVLLVGGKIFVEGAASLARELGMSESLVGLTIVAVGTSLPELASSIVAALRRHADLAVGNIVGSNIFNITAVLGLASVAQPVEGSLAAGWVEIVAMLVLTAVSALLLRGERLISRLEGGLLLLAYAGFLVLIA